MTGDPLFPPLMRGVGVTGSADPFAKARALAALGCDGGTLVHNVQADRLRAALVFAPEVPLGQAVAMLPACAVGFQNALGALAPPEVAVHLTWDGDIRVNGAGCGRLRMASATTDAAEMPDWLLVGIEVPFLPTGPDAGHDPTVTTLHDEGCVEMAPVALLESWARHTLVWINRWSDEGPQPLHREWMGLVQGVGEPATIAGQSGTFVGADEHFGMLMRDRDTTHLIPMTRLLEDTP